MRRREGPGFVFTLNGRRALAAVDETTRQFYQAIESQRMDLAARTAVVEGVDLFLQSREFQPIACRQ